MTRTKRAMDEKELLSRMAANGVRHGYELSKRLGVSPSTTSRWLRGLTPITPGQAALVRERLPKGR